MLKAEFEAFNRASGDWLHCTAHSHHPWPDVTRAAQLEYWSDSVHLTDRKWSKIFDEVVPEAQRHIARHLRVPDPAQIAFAPNTHEFVARLYSCLDWTRPLRVVTSAHEFHSFERQTRRLEETGRLEVVRVAAEPYHSFLDRFCSQAAQRCDMVWLSHVFYDSGFVVPDLDRIAEAVASKALVVFDGYHAFGALAADLSSIADRAFYLAGGYKYAMAGEGACFLVAPGGSTLRPLFTGWFADFAALGGPAVEVGYGPSGMRFFGATFDASGLYRLNAVMRMLATRGVDFAAIHAHVETLQDRFLTALKRQPMVALPLERLTPSKGIARGNFLTFALPWAERAESALISQRVSVDRRGDRLRFGFGAYHDESFVDRLMERVRCALSDDVEQADRADARNER